MKEAIMSRKHFLKILSIVQPIHLVQKLLMGCFLDVMFITEPTVQNKALRHKIK